MKPEKLTVTLCFIMLLFSGIDGFARSDIVTPENIRDAVLGRGDFTQEEQQQLDVNNDGRISIADLLYFRSHCDVFASLTGEHVGVFYRSNADLLAGQGEAFGQIPFALNITGESPLEGEIDNRAEADDGYYSLYFPEALIPVTFLQASSGNDLKFQIEFETPSSNLAPDTNLTHKQLTTNN